MRILVATISLLLIAVHCIAQAPLSGYPAAEHATQSDLFFGRSVPDPYRLLEIDTLQSTKEWLEKERNLGKKYFDRILNRYRLNAQFQENSYTTFPSYLKSGRYFFSRVQYIGYEDPCLLIHHKMMDEGSIIINPLEYQKGRGDRVRIGGFAVSDNDKYLAFCLSHKGSDWQEIRVKSIQSNHQLKDELSQVKFSNIEWSGDGFYYMSYSSSGTNALKDRTERAALRYHRLGSPQTQDVIIYQVKDDPLAKISFAKTPLGEYLIVYDDHEEQGRPVSQIVSISLEGETSGKQQMIIRTDKGGTNEVLGIFNKKFLVRSTMGAPRGRLLLFDPAVDNEADEFVPQIEEVLHDAHIAGNKIICTYLKDIDYSGVTFDSTGAVVNHVNYPSGCSISEFTCSPRDSIAIFNYYSFLHPPVVYEYNVNDLVFKRVAQTEVAYNYQDFVITKVHYTSADGTVIPMMIAAKKGLKKDGSAPTILYGYGGNGVVMTPFFNSSFISHMQNGGIIAVPCIRGGNEFGDEWHQQGSLMKKQHVFDDFIAAAGYLCKEGYTTKERLALMGGSNGGLLVAAVINQHPDICRVAIADRGVYDMLRFQHYTIGHAWQHEYGAINDSAQFAYLLGYSPLHNITKGADYPAILVLTADHDDRVVPNHSYKYIAALQDNTSGHLPILLHVEKNAGHQTSSSEKEALIYSFIYDQMGIPSKKTGILD